MKNKVGSPEARAIVVMLLQRYRKAWRKVEQDVYTANYLDWLRSHRAFVEIAIATDAAKRILYGQDK